MSKKSEDPKKLPPPPLSERTKGNLIQAPESKDMAEHLKILLGGPDVTVPSKNDKKRLETTLGKKDANPYIRARAEILSKATAWRKNEIERMEASGDVDNRFYEDFVKQIAALGDKFSLTKPSK